jgi:gamma-glutamyl:cysteine ligase YbdK (ATP-grasp superfamily)
MAAPLMLGVEEEFQLVDPRSSDLSSGYDRLMRAGNALLATHGQCSRAIV